MWYSTPSCFEVGRQHVLGEPRLLLVHVHGDDLELDRRNLLQVQQYVEHGVAVLAAGQADHDLVAVFDHVEVGDRFAGQAAQALLQFVLVDRKSAHDAKSVRCDERPAFYAKTLRLWSQVVATGRFAFYRPHGD